LVRVKAIQETIKHATTNRTLKIIENSVIENEKDCESIMPPSSEFEERTPVPFSVEL
jgi:hypothetical protein